MKQRKQRTTYRRRTRQQIKEDIESSSKVCADCAVRKPFSEFFKDSKGIDGCHISCKSCLKAYNESRKGNLRDSALKYNYGIGLAEYNKMLSEQNGKCAICSATTSQRAKMPHLVVDHCHESEEVRGLLCDLCNKGLGCFQDDHERLIKAARYLYFKEKPGIKAADNE